LAVDKFFEVQRIIERRRAEEKRRRDELNELKRQKLFEKRTLVRLDKYGF
jgi:hypothetical protein